DARSPSFADRGRYCRLDLRLIKLVGQKAFDHLDFFALLLREVLSLTLFIQCDRFATLLDHRLQHPLNLGVRKTPGITASPRNNVTSLELSQDQANSRDRAGLSRLHRLFEPVGEGLTQHWHAPLRSTF